MAPATIFTAATPKPQDPSLTTSDSTASELLIYVHSDAAAQREPGSHNTSAPPPHQQLCRCKRPFSAWIKTYARNIGMSLPNKFLAFFVLIPIEFQADIYP